MSTNRYVRPAGPWRPQGPPFYLSSQGDRLGLPSVVVEHPRVKDNRQLSRIGGVLAQACDNYFNAPRRGDDRNFADWQLAEVRVVLAPCEAEISKTFAIAAAAVEMVDEAYAAFGIEPPTRPFCVTVAGDSPVVDSSVIAPPAVTDEEVASLRSELDRLRSENESLAAQVEQLTAPSAATTPTVSPSTPHPHRRPPARN